MQKKQITLVIASLLIVILSVSLAYYTTKILGKGKTIEVTSSNLQIVFTDTDGSISGVDIEPGWSDTKTFSVKNNSKEEYKYNIIIKDLVNTFVTEGYLQYRITSTNGYNMTEFKDVPKSNIAADTVLAYSISIPVGETQNYTIEIKYPNDENVDQGDDMGKVLTGTLFISEGTKEPITLYTQLLADKSTRPGERTDFSNVLTTNNTNTLYTGTEEEKEIYYFAGNATDNWVKFGGFYWRIIRTNSDGSIRMMYHGTSTTTTEGYITTSAFNQVSTDPLYVGYMYGTSGSLENNRANTNESVVKQTIDTWYKENLESYTKYLSLTAVYCNDREVDSSNTYAVDSAFNYVSNERLNTNQTPTYNCKATEDRFTVDKSTGNGKLTYPVALITADELVFAGGKWITNAQTWYYYNSANSSSVGKKWWWTMTPKNWNRTNVSIISVSGSSFPGFISSYGVTTEIVLRPVISIKSCVKYSSGDGSSSNPYIVEETESSC